MQHKCTKYPNFLSDMSLIKLVQSQLSVVRNEVHWQQLCLIRILPLSFACDFPCTGSIHLLIISKHGRLVLCLPGRARPDELRRHLIKIQITLFDKTADLSLVSIIDGSTVMKGAAHGSVPLQNKGEQGISTGSILVIHSVLAPHPPLVLSCDA